MKKGQINVFFWRLFSHNNEILPTQDVKGQLCILHADLPLVYEIYRVFNNDCQNFKLCTRARSWERYIFLMMFGHFEIVSSKIPRIFMYFQILGDL